MYNTEQSRKFAVHVIGSEENVQERLLSQLLQDWEVLETKPGEDAGVKTQLCVLPIKLMWTI